MTSLLDGVRGLGAALLDFVYPLHCLACGEGMEEGEEYLCKVCWGEILVQPGPRCRRCSCPLESVAAVCNNCAVWEPAFERALVLGPFAGAMQQAIHALKFLHQQELGRKLGRCLGQSPEFAGILQTVDLLVPVPLHPARERERGYNQSLSIAQGMAEVMGCTLDSRLLKRCIPTRQQAKLDARIRRQNLHAAFQVVGDLPRHECIGVVDDVLTTSATLNACACALQEAGARKIWVIALASPFRISA